MKSNLSKIYTSKNFLSHACSFGGQKWSSWDQCRMKFMKCSNVLFHFSAAPVCSFGLLKLIFSAHLRTLLSNFSVLRKSEKSEDIYWWFFKLFKYECVFLRLNITNPLSSNNLKLFLTIFITYSVKSLSATLTPNGSSVPPSIMLTAP